MGRLRNIGRLRAGGSANSGPPLTNMVAWFRKGVGITSAANAVSAWADQTGLGSRDYAQATGASQPTLQGDGTILFNGTSHFLKTPAFTLLQPCTRYLRIKQVAWTSNKYILDGNSTDAGSMQQTGASPGISAFAGAQFGQNSNLAVGSFGSLCIVFNGASSIVNVNGNATAPAAGGAANPGGLTLGANAGSSSLGNIQVAEEIVYNVAHDATTQAAVIAYLNTL